MCWSQIYQSREDAHMILKTQNWIKFSNFENVDGQWLFSSSSILSWLSTTTSVLQLYFGENDVLTHFREAGIKEFFYLR